MAELTIKERYDDISRRLLEHDAARKIIEGELLALQHSCPHKNSMQWKDGGWGRMPSTEFECRDCGKRKSY